MNILLAILAVAFAALCVWLSVRIVNRRERWAKWTWATVLGLPVLYVASFGPACWWVSRVQVTQEQGAHKWTIRTVPRFYRPLLNEYTPKPICDAFRRYGQIGVN